jgi:hypothetical protein
MQNHIRDKRRAIRLTRGLLESPLSEIHWRSYRPNPIEFWNVRDINQMTVILKEMNTYGSDEVWRVTVNVTANRMRNPLSKRRCR